MKRAAAKFENIIMAIIVVLGLILFVVPEAASRPS
jgi:hypothetical protein